VKVEIMTEFVEDFSAAFEGVKMMVFILGEELEDGAVVGDGLVMTTGESAVSADVGAAEVRASTLYVEGAASMVLE